VTKVDSAMYADMQLLTLLLVHVSFMELGLRMFAECEKWIAGLIGKEIYNNKLMVKQINGKTGRSSKAHNSLTWVLNH